MSAPSIENQGLHRPKTKNCAKNNLKNEVYKSLIYCVNIIEQYILAH